MTSAIRKGAFHFPSIATTDDAVRFVEASRNALNAARRAGWTIAHMHIVFAQDYSDLLRNCRLFLKTETLGALKRGSWGASAYAGFEPGDGEIFVTGNANSAFRRTDLEAQLRERGVERVNVMGLATQFSVEHTVRDCRRHGVSRQDFRGLLRLRRYGGPSRLAADADAVGRCREQR